jgi:hypothetical protein
MYFFSINTNSEDYIQLQTDVSLINPKNGVIVGYLKKDTILKRPSITDLDDCDLGDNDRFKILLDLENIDQKERKYIKRSNLTTNDFEWLYNSLTVKQN